MTTFKRYLIGALGVAILAGTLVLTNPQPASTQGGGPGPAQVQVVNTTAQPVPTTAQGTTTIAGNVGLTGMPTVQVGNSASSPVLVRDVDNPAKQPFRKGIITAINNGSAVGVGNFVDIPLGKRFVVEHISALTKVPTNQKVLAVQVQSMIDCAAVDHWFTATFTGAGAEGTLGIGTEGPQDVFVTSALRLASTSTHRVPVLS